MTRGRRSPGGARGRRTGGARRRHEGGRHVDEEEAATAAAGIAETDLAEINTATKQSYEQQLRVTTEIDCFG